MQSSVNKNRCESRAVSAETPLKKLKKKDLLGKIYFCKSFIGNKQQNIYTYFKNRKQNYKFNTFVSH